jgi:hypothetical protein
MLRRHACRYSLPPRDCTISGCTFRRHTRHGMPSAPHLTASTHAALHVRAQHSGTLVATAAATLSAGQEFDEPLRHRKRRQWSGPVWGSSGSSGREAQLLLEAQVWLREVFTDGVLAHGHELSTATCAGGSRASRGGTANGRKLTQQRQAASVVR